MSLPHQSDTPATLGDELALAGSSACRDEAVPGFDSPMQLTAPLTPLRRWTEEPSEGETAVGRAVGTRGIPIMGDESDEPPQAHAPPAGWPNDPVEVLRLLHPRLLAAARTVDRAGAEDLVQDTLVEILVRYPGFEGVAHPLGYAKVTMFRLAYARHGRRGMEIPADVQQRMEGDLRPDPANQVIDRLWTMDALATLGRKQRACLVLRYLEGLDNDAIALVLGCRPSTVRGQIARALARMRIVLDQPEEDRHEP